MKRGGMQRPAAAYRRGRSYDRVAKAGKSERSLERPQLGLSGQERLLKVSRNVSILWPLPPARSQIRVYPSLVVP